jgi:PTH1 family peptidyl-tRNA hydrolase
MPTPIKLIVGLGNPGEKYAKTRHNAGAWLVEALARAQSTTLRPETKFQGKVATISLAAQECQLLIPTTYMNNSGLSVRALAQFHKIPPEAILVVHDEIDLPPGVARLKFDGGTGGHNGLKDLVAQLQTKQFYRLRVGVGHPGNSEDVADYVLNSPSKAERLLIDAALQRAEEVLAWVVEGDHQKAMQQLHSE